MALPFGLILLQANDLDRLDQPRTRLIELEPDHAVVIAAANLYLLRLLLAEGHDLNIGCRLALVQQPDFKLVID